jgi:hypothetical protein
MFHGNCSTGSQVERWDIQYTEVERWDIQYTEVERWDIQYTEVKGGTYNTQKLKVGHTIHRS